MSHMRWLGFVCVALFVVGIVGTPAIGASAAEELTKRLPDDVIGFVATSGGDALKADFNKTAVGRICNDPGVRKFYEAIKTELISKAAEGTGDPNVSKQVDEVIKYARLAISRPILLGLSQVPVKDGPPIGGFAILDAGDRKAEFTAIVSKLETMIGQEVVDAEVGSLKVRQFKENNEFPLYWGWVGNSFVIAVNDAQGAAAKHVSQPRASAPAYLSKVTAAGDALILHGDCQKIHSLMATIIREEEGEAAVGTLTTVLKNLGLSDSKGFTARVGFAGTDVIAQSVVEVPKQTGGVLASFKPVDLSWLRVVDVRAVTASAFNWDVASLYDTIMNTLKGAMPEQDFTEMQEAISNVESELNLKIRGDLLASLAGPTVFYAMPAGVMPEAPMGGFVVLAKLNNAASFEKSMAALGEFAGKMSEGMLQVGTQTRDDGRVVHIWTVAPLAMAGIMPTWSIVNDHVVLGSSEGLCDQAVAQFISKDPAAKSLLDAEGFKKVAGQLPKEILGFTYTDSQVQFNQMMMQLQQFWPMAAMMASQNGFKLPAVLPSLTHIAKDMGPSCSYSYYGSDGLYSYNRGPGIEVGLAAVAGGAVGAGVALPALAKAREQARITVDMSNLKQIGLALHMYAQDNNGKFPSDLQNAEKYYGNAKILVSPRKPRDFEGPSYLYVPDQNETGNSGNIVAYENPDFAGEDIVALFLDGHVERLTPDRFQEELAATYERLGREMPGEESEDEEEVQEEENSQEEGDSEDEEESEDEGDSEDEEDSEDNDNSEDQGETENGGEPVVLLQLQM
ncbi:MAG: DUF1559 domain-containing protein [Solirubrobacterales bacterium]